MPPILFMYRCGRGGDNYLHRVPWWTLVDLPAASVGSEKFARGNAAIDWLLGSPALAPHKGCCRAHNFLGPPDPCPFSDQFSSWLLQFYHDTNM